MLEPGDLSQNGYGFDDDDDDVFQRNEKLLVVQCSSAESEV